MNRIEHYIGVSFVDFVASCTQSQSFIDSDFPKIHPTCSWLPSYLVIFFTVWYTYSHFCYINLVCILFFGDPRLCLDSLVYHNKSKLSYRTYLWARMIHWNQYKTPKLVLNSFILLILWQTYHQPISLS